MQTAETARRRKGNQVLFLALELGRREWTLGFATGIGKRPRERTVVAGDAAGLEAEIVRAKRRFGHRDSAEVVSCYEAGRDGFWIHRFLESIGVQNHVVDSSSIEVNRRRRRRKTDRLDLESLLRLLMRFWAGERRVWSVVRVPSPEAEDARQLHRELQTLKRDRTRVTNRIKALLATQGILQVELGPGFETELDRIVLWDGLAVPDQTRNRLRREWAKVQGLTRQICQVQAERRVLLRTSTDPAVAKVRQLHELCGIGINSAWLYVMEFFGWREFRNRREVGALAGLTPTPHQSGDLDQERGIDKAGNRYVRAMAIEIAWCWLRFQPESALTRWYEARFAHGSSRLRRIGIVAVARKLLIELWRYLETGALPDGAVTRA
ncbi:MAG TPA: IS110 family transposase [Propionibacteriaceae bacterium]|nr:IS110 family transposase [Propionibacteriaceae bacterium]